jgi:hypothetical protein
MYLVKVVGVGKNRVTSRARKCAVVPRVVMARKS